MLSADLNYDKQEEDQVYQEENKELETEENQAEGKLFSKMKIYVEIFNNNNDQSDLLDEILTNNGAILIKKLVKSLDFIVFKDGKNKTVEYALDNNIKLVSPLWVHESVKENTLQNYEKYLIKKTFTDLHFQTSILKSTTENTKVKRKYDQLSKSPDVRREDQSNKKKITANTNIKSEVLAVSNKEENKINILPIVSKSEVKPNNKITNFFKSFEKPESKIENEKKVVDDTPLIKISSVGIGEENKFKIISCVKSLGKYNYLGEKMEFFKDSEFIVINDVYLKNDARLLYAIMNQKKLISIKYFTESKVCSAYKENILDYIKEYPINFESLNEKNEQLPFQENKYKFHVHPSVYEKEPLKMEVISIVLKLLGAEVENNIRLSEICILNKENASEYFPGHIRLVNEIFLFDCLYNFKVMEFDNLKYHPEKVIVKKNKENK